MTRTVVITGATSGIGRAAARESAGRGDRLVLAARSPATLAEVREECRAAGGPVLVVPTDVTTPDAVDELARAALAEFGRIDVRVHTAAVMPVAPHEGIIFTPNPAGESVRGGWLPELSQVVRSVGRMGATVGSAVRRWLG